MVAKMHHSATYRCELHSGNTVPTEYHCLALPVKAQHIRTIHNRLIA